MDEGTNDDSNGSNNFNNDDSNNNNEPPPQSIRRKTRRNNRQGTTSRQYQYQQQQQYKPQGNETLASYEERQRSQLDWMVRNTNNVLGEDAPAVGEMPIYLIRITYSLLQVWARRSVTVKDSRSAHVIERLLQRLVAEKNAGPPNNVYIGVDSFNAVLEGWANSNESGSGERAEKILLQMEQVHCLKPTCRSYNAVIKAYVKNGNRNTAANKVYDLVTKMEATNDPQVLPNKRSYNLLLYSLANAPSSVEDAPERAEAVLERMLSRYRIHQQKIEAARRVDANVRIFENFKPDLNSFNQVIGAWARGRRPGYEGRMERIYDLLLEWSDELDVQPDRDTFNAIMGGWLKSDDRDAITKIQDTFQAMEESYKNGNKSARPDEVAINTLHVAFNKHTRTIPTSRVDHNERLLALEEEYKIPPNFLSQNILMESIIKSGRTDAPELAYSLLVSMEEDFRGGQVEMKPDQCSYSSVINAYIMYQREEIAEKTEELLQRMWDLHRTHGGRRPDVAVYNSVLNAYASMDSPHGLERVKELLRDMEQGENGEYPKPNLVTYNTVIKALRSGNKEEGAVFAENILSTLENRGQREPMYLPDNYSYTSVISAYGRSNSRKKAEKALEILTRMISSYESGNKKAIPTTFSFNAALNACAFVEGSEREKAGAFDTAMKINKLRLKCPYEFRPDSTWYGTMLRACSSLLPPSERREIEVDRFFREACKMGCVGRLVSTQLKFAATPEQYSRLTDREVDDRIVLKELPNEWTRNAKDSRRFVYKAYASDNTSMQTNS
jgi:hypothetical protein